MRDWLLSYPSMQYPREFKSFQSAALHALKKEHVVQDMSATLNRKLSVTLASISDSLPPMNPGWFNSGFNDVFVQLPLFLRMCWLKTISGAWCTSVRLHSVMDRPCIFGCADTRDELVHYLICPVLWHFARECLNVQEPSVQVDARLCLCNPSVEKFKLLVFCHSLYHSRVNDSVCMNSEGLPNSGQCVQFRAIDLARQCYHLVNG